MGHDAAQWVGRGKKLPMSHETLETRRDLFWRRAQGAYRHMFSGIDVGGFKEYDDSTKRAQCKPTVQSRVRHEKILLMVC